MKMSFVILLPSTSGSSAPHHHLVERTGALGKKLDEHVPLVTQKRSKIVAVMRKEKTLQNHKHIVIWALDSHRCAENASMNFTNE